MTETSLTVKWTTSKARDTYGYNICTLTDTTTGKKYRCNGGGYDMLGTSFGQWLEDVHQSALERLENRSEFYGMTNDLGFIRLDGAAGLGSMIYIAEAIGLTVRKLMNRKGNVEGFIVSDGQ